MESLASFLKFMEVTYWVFLILSLIICIIYIDKINISMYKQTILIILNIIQDKIQSIKESFVKIFKKK